MENDVNKKSNKILLIIAIILAFIACGYTFYNGYSKADKSDLKATNEKVSELDTLTQDHSSRLTTVENTTSSIETKVNTLETEQQSLTANVDSLTTKVEALKKASENYASKKEVQSLIAKVDAYNKKFAKREDIETLKERIAKMESQNLAASNKPTSAVLENGTYTVEGKATLTPTNMSPSAQVESQNITPSTVSGINQATPPPAQQETRKSRRGSNGPVTGTKIP